MRHFPPSSLWLLGALLGVLATSSLPAADLPAGWTTTPLDRCDREPLKLTHPDSRRQKHEFSRFTLDLARDARVNGASARWEFTPLPRTATAALAVGSGPYAGSGLALWIKNPRGHLLAVALRLTDAAGTVWQTRPQDLDRGPRWTRYVLPLTALIRPDEAGPVPPFARVALAFSGIKPGQSHQLYLDEIETLTAPLPEVRVEKLQAAEQAAAGQKLTVSCVVTVPVGLLYPVTLEVALDKAEVAGVAVSLALESGGPEAAGQSVELPLARRLAAGDYRLRLRSTSARLVGEVSRDVRLVGVTDSPHAGVACTPQSGHFLAEGRALSVIGGWHTGDGPCQGASWVMVPLTVGQKPGGLSLPWWTGPDGYDFTVVDRLLGTVLAANPEAYLLPVIALDAPEWWKTKHPGELMVYGEGKPLLPATVPSACRTHASWASRLWRQDAASALTRLLEHLHQGPFGPALLGYQVAAGEGGAWIYPGAAQGVLADYGPRQQEAFREWLKRKYGEVSALRVAWGQPFDPPTSAEARKESAAIMGWSQVRIPRPEMRWRGMPVAVRNLGTPQESIEYGLLHDPTVSQEVVDYQVFASDLVWETVAHFARVVRQSAGKRLVGAAYGHVLDLAATRAGLTAGGHLGLGPMLESPDLDFVVGPSAGGEATTPPQATVLGASLSEHGKLWMAPVTAQAGLGGGLLPLTGRGVVAQEGFNPQQWPARLTELVSGADRRATCEIAVVVDDISAAYMASGAELSKPLLADQRLGLSLLGAPCDLWLLDDVLQGKAPRYKFYVMLNAFYLDAGARAQLLQTLNATPCTVLWVYAAGSLDQALGGRTMKELTGLTIVQRPGRGLVQVRVEGEPAYNYGGPQAFGPRFACVDEQGDVRGRLVGTEFAGLAVKTYGQFRSVWSAAPHLPAALLRSLAREAGVHLYAEEGTGIYACAGLLGVRAAGTPPLVSLPQAADIYDLTTGKLLGKGQREFRPDLKSGVLGWYYLAPAPSTP